MISASLVMRRTLKVCVMCACVMCACVCHLYDVVCVYNPEDIRHTHFGGFLKKKSKDESIGDSDRVRPGNGEVCVSSFYPARGEV